MLKLKNILLTILAVLALLIIAGMIYESLAEATDRSTYKPLGRLVDVDGRQAHIFCLGDRLPDQTTVVLEAGGGDNVYTWYTMMAEVSQFTRVCAVDRAGLGWSEASSNPRTAVNIANELHQTLQAAGEQAPYVLAGHSFGGLVMRVYAAQYPDEVSGLVLVDSTNAEDFVTYDPLLTRSIALDVLGPALIQRVGLLRLIITEPRSVMEFFKAVPDSLVPEAWALVLRADTLWVMTQELYMLLDSAEEAVELGTLGDLPVIAFVTSAEPGLIFPEGYLDHFEALSTDSTVYPSDGGHYVHIEQPDLVAAAIQDLVER